MGGMLGNKRQDRGKKIQGARNLGGDFLGKCQKGVEKLFGGSKKWWEFFWGSQQFWGGEFFRKNLKKKNPGGGSGKLSIKKFRGDFLGGVVYRGTCVGECWEIKDKIGENKISGGQKFWGELLVEMLKKGGTTFLGECWGSCEPQQILGGEFLEKCQRKKFIGEILGG